MYGDIEYADDDFETTFTQMPVAEPIGSWSFDSDMGVQNIFLLSISFFAMVFNISFLFWFCARRGARGNQENKKSADSIALRLASMTTDAKFAYYDKLFQRQGNQIQLTEDDIIAVSLTKDAQENTSTSFDAERKGIELEKEEQKLPVQNRSNDDGDTAIQDVEGGMPLVYLRPGAINTRAKQNISNFDETLASETNGECVICFEDYKAGDTLVCNMYGCRNNSIFLKKCTMNENKSSPKGCPHVYHKTCLVKYLTNRKISQKGLQNGEGDNPSCPICRRPYIELLPILSVIGKDEEVSETSIDDGDSSSNNFNGISGNENGV